MKKKIILYSSSFSSSGGGGLTYLIRTAEAFGQLGWLVTVCLPKTMSEAEIKKNYRLPQVKIRMIDDGGRSLIRQLQIAVLEFFKYDAIVYHSNQPPRINFIRNSFILCDFPLIKKLKFKDRIRLVLWKGIIVNSKYTQSWVMQYWNRNSYVLHPPVSPLPITGKKPLQLLNIGRFHGGGRSKRQDLIIEAFINLTKCSPLKWELHLAGFVQSRQYINNLRKKSNGYNVVFHENIDVIEKEKLLAQSSIYVHACGYGIDQTQNPELAEHYGIVVVEAMAAGCVPFVIAKGGPKEIVDNSKNGFYWEEVPDLVEKIQNLTKDEQRFKLMVKSTILKSREFSPRAFQESLKKLLFIN